MSFTWKLLAYNSCIIPRNHTKILWSKSLFINRGTNSGDCEMLHVKSGIKSSHNSFVNHSWKPPRGVDDKVFTILPSSVDEGINSLTIICAAWFTVVFRHLAIVPWVFLHDKIFRFSDVIRKCTYIHHLWGKVGRGVGGTWDNGKIFAVYVLSPSGPVTHHSLHDVAKHKPHLGHFWENVTFAIPT